MTKRDTDVDAKDGGKSLSGAFRGKPVPLIVVGVVALVAGLVIGGFALPRLLSSNPIYGKTTLTSDELSDTVATYTYDGTSYDVSAQDVIESVESLSTAQNDDGTYDVPKQSDALTYVRGQILTKVAEAQGYTATDDEISDYATSALGTDDYDTIASQYGMDSDQVKAQIKMSCEVEKLYSAVVSSTSTAAIPTMPTEPADGNSDEATSEYGAYIVGLCGDEWDSTTESWASTDGPYYAALSSDTFSSTSGTYTEAETAYSVAYQEYESAQTEVSNAWSSYVDGYLSKATVTFNTLMA